jgi:glycosyltransferase involved in cell wall biosynthesis/drug/metabolite transporter (DMT)-like permease
MLTVAIGCAAAAACCYAGTAHLQHGAVRRATTEPVLRRAGVRAVLRSPGWYLGLVLALAGAALHVLALTMAPLVVVQPIGVLSLVATVFLAKTKPRPALLAAMLMSVGGVFVFVLMSAGASTSGAAVPGVGSAQWAALGAVVLAAFGRRAGNRLRCVLYALATALLFGLASALVRALAQTLQTGGATGLLTVIAGEVVVAVVAGSWLLHQAYASGPAAVVVGATTIVDPLTAVLIGVFAYGEAPRAALAGATVPALVAVAGLVVLARVAPAPARPARRGRDGARRIVIAADTYPPDVNGASHFASRLAAGLAGRGHEVHVICPSATSRNSTEVTGAVTVHRVGAIRTPFHPTFRVCPPWRAARTVPSLLARIEPDLVHTQAHFLLGRSAVRAATAAGIPVVATNHFMPENLLGYGPLPRWSHQVLSRLAWRDLVRVFGRANAVTAPTPRAVALLERNGLAGPAVAISCGIDREHFTAGQAGSSDDPSVLFVGRLDAEKNVHELLRAAAMLSARVELVGDGSERGRLEALVSELGIGDRVTFRGFVSDEDLVRAYQRCDVFCMPGTAELQSLATMEAMAAGKPVVAADAMALPHLVHPGRNGWLYQPGDVTGLARSLADALSDAETRTAMGKASRELIAAHDIEHTLDAFERLYLDVAGKTAVRREQIAA